LLDITTDQFLLINSVDCLSVVLSYPMRNFCCNFGGRRGVVRIQVSSTVIL
jgi:hypothetical protein